jgi:hypothetical protein
MLYLTNCDQKKYRSLLRTFRTQYSLNNNQYHTTLTKAMDVLSNHMWDNAFKENTKRIKLKSKAIRKHKGKHNDKESVEDGEKSLVQMKVKERRTH